MVSQFEKYSYRLLVNVLMQFGLTDGFALVSKGYSVVHWQQAQKNSLAVNLEKAGAAKDKKQMAVTVVKSKTQAQKAATQRGNQAVNHRGRTKNAKLRA